MKTHDVSLHVLIIYYRYQIYQPDIQSARLPQKQNFITVIQLHSFSISPKFPKQKLDMLVPVH